MFDSNKSGIKSCLIKLLPLNDEDKKFVKDLEREKLEHNEEYYLFVNKVEEFRRHYISAPLLYRSAVKESFRNELQECCDNLKNAINKTKSKNKDEMEK